MFIKSICALAVLFSVYATNPMIIAQQIHKANNYIFLKKLFQRRANQVMDDLISMTPLHARNALQHMGYNQRNQFRKWCPAQQKEQYSFLFVSDTEFEQWIQKETQGKQETMHTFLSEPIKKAAIDKNTNDVRRLVYKETASPIAFPLQRRSSKIEKEWLKSKGIVIKGRDDILFLHDEKMQEFVLKFYSNDSIIAELFGSRIGVAMNFPMNHVRFIPYAQKTAPFLRQEKNEFCERATLHTVVPGKPVAWYEDSNTTPHSCMSLCGGLICNRVLDIISCNHDLCTLVALDIFTNNRDRNPMNYFFDAENSKHYGIDMGFCLYSTPIGFDRLSICDWLEYTSFSGHCAHRTYDFLIGCSSEQCSEDNLKALHSIGNTLQQLSSVFSVDHLYHEWLETVKEVGSLITEAEKTFMKICFHYDRYWIKKIIQEINRLTTEMK